MESQGTQLNNHGGIHLHSFLGFTSNFPILKFNYYNCRFLIACELINNIN